MNNKELLIPEFVEHWEKDRKEKAEIKMTLEMAERREMISMILLGLSAGMTIAIAICLALIAKGVMW